MNKPTKSSKNSRKPKGSSVPATLEVESKGGRLNIAHVERMIEKLKVRAEIDQETLQDCIYILDDFVDTLDDLEMSLEDETTEDELQEIYDNILAAVEEVNSYGNDPYYRTYFSQQAYEDFMLEESLLLNP